MIWSQNMKKPNQNRAGYTLLEISMIVLILTLLALLLVPGINKMRNEAQRTRCLDNLRQINSAAQQYYTEFTNATTPTSTELKNYFQLLSFPVCPAGGNYSIPANSSDQPTCDVDAALNHKLD